jgi:hypothetical protein
MNTEQQIQQVEVAIEDAKNHVAFGEAMSRLEKNRDFQLVIEQGFLRDEALRLVGLTAEINLAPAQMESVHASIRGIGEFKAWWRGRKVFAAQMRDTVTEYEGVLDEIRADEGNEADSEGAE